MPQPRILAFQNQESWHFMDEDGCSHPSEIAIFPGCHYNDVRKFPQRI
jgi:hypothetical protein